MIPSILPFLIPSAPLGREGLDGKHRFEVFKCFFPALPGANIVEDSLAAPGIPQLGDAHLTAPGYVCIDREVYPVGKSKSQTRVVCRFDSVDDVLIYVDGTLQNTSTRLDRTNKPLHVNYKPDGNATDVLSWTAGETWPTGWYRQHTSAPILLPHTTLSFEGLIANIDYKIAYGYIPAYRGKYNSAKWEDGDPHTWLCTRFRIQEIVTQLAKKGPWRYSVQFEYVGRKTPSGQTFETWDHLLVFQDFHSQNAMPNIDPPAGGYPTRKEGNGWKVSELYSEVDFTLLSSSLKWPKVLE